MLKQFGTGLTTTRTKWEIKTDLEQDVFLDYHVVN